LITKKHLEFVGEWGATLLLIIGVALTSYKVMPANLIVSSAASVAWVGLGLYWKKWSLVVVNLLLGAIYISGLFF